ncbi:MAG: DUF5063 domain-containing protein [Bacteroidales bacterium]|nr:DUF5063 domain-containing protein [Bacteroidales bacterium]
MDEYNQVYQREAIELVAVAKEYVAFLEKSQEYSKDEFVEQSLKILPLLYLKGVMLPEIEDYDDSFSEKFVDEATWSYIQQSAASRLDEDDDYIQVQDATMMSSMDSMSVGLSEIYADLYQEMADLVGAYRLANDGVMLAALACCRNNFPDYWGVRLLALLKGLHEIKYRRDD